MHDHHPSLQVTFHPQTPFNGQFATNAPLNPLNDDEKRHKRLSCCQTRTDLRVQWADGSAKRRKQDDERGEEELLCWDSKRRPRPKEDVAGVELDDERRPAEEDAVVERVDDRDSTWNFPSYYCCCYDYDGGRKYLKQNAGGRKGNNRNIPFIIAAFSCRPSTDINRAALIKRLTRVACHGSCVHSRR